MNEPVMPSPEPDRSLGYEARDVNVWYVIAFGVGLALMVVAVLPLMDWTFVGFERSAERRDVAPSPLARSQEPPLPRLESQPSANLAALRRREDAVLNNYRWIDKQQGVVQIPVERAMELMVKRGLPEPKPAKESSKAEDAGGGKEEPNDRPAAKKREAQR